MSDFLYDLVVGYLTQKNIETKAQRVFDKERKKREQEGMNQAVERIRTSQR